MTDRTELFAVALDSLPEGIVLLNEQGMVVLWNRAAEAVTGYTSVKLIDHPPPKAFESLIQRREAALTRKEKNEDEQFDAGLIQVRHSKGHILPVIVRSLPLCNESGDQIGTALAFHPTESLDKLPRGECNESEENPRAQADFQERLSVDFDDFSHSGLPMGVLWIVVDQARELRRSHGSNACRAMIEIVQRALAHGLRPAEEISRWGDDEFLVISHERTASMLADHAQALAGLVRVAEFRWWGDRVSLSVSIGAAQAEKNESLADLLDRSRNAMLESFHAGGNKVTQAPGGRSCLPL
jgi:PAS domain S-box-containing protein/diguanylate cyclase (GGDEF)-like protein